VRVPGGRSDVASGSPEARQLAEVAAYAAQMADLVGDLLVVSAFDTIEVVSSDATFVVRRDARGDLLAIKGDRAADLTALRGAIGLAEGT
jgi:hypothetical protein